MDLAVGREVPGRGSGLSPCMVSLWSSSSRRRGWAALPRAASNVIVSCPAECANNRLAVSTSLGAGSGVWAGEDVVGAFPVGAGTTGRGVTKLSSAAELAPEAVSASETT